MRISFREVCPRAVVLFLVIFFRKREGGSSRGHDEHTDPTGARWVIMTKVDPYPIRISSARNPLPSLLNYVVSGELHRVRGGAEAIFPIAATFVHLEG